MIGTLLKRLLEGRNRHLTFVGLALGLVLILALTGGGRDAQRADSLAASAMLRDGLVVGDDGVVPADTVAAWQRVAAALDAGGLAAPLGLDAGLPLRVRHATEPVDAEATAATLRQVGLQPVAPRVEADGAWLAVGSLTIAEESVTGGHLGVVARYQGPGVDVDDHPGGVERNASRIAGPWWAVVPPLLAVLVALFYGRAVIALGLAVVAGAGLVTSFEPIELTVASLGYVVGALTDSFKLYILGFTLALVGMVQVTARSGGNQGLIDALGKLARNARSTRLATFFMGLVVFFDDYANALVVGTSARSMTDRQRISREKLAFIVDATAAPVAGIAIISTWVGYEIGLFDALAGELGWQTSGFAILIDVLPMRFYCLFMLVFVVANAWLGRDYGPMYAAEQRAAAGDVGAVETSAATRRLLARVEPARGTPARWYNAAVPVLVTLAGVIVGVAIDGSAAIEVDTGVAPDLGTFIGWREVFSAADNGFVLFVSSVLGSLTAIAMAAGQRILRLGDALHAWVAGVRMMSIAVVILVLAWCIQAVTNDLGTSFYLVSVLEPVLHPAVLPIVIFLAAAAVAFATGTSWGTMGILLPALIPMVWTMTGDLTLTVLCMGVVLDGAIFGDHCSPISDTTVMSSLASGCDHIAHVRTQMPYAVTVMILAGGIGYVLTPAGLPVVAAHALGIAAIIGVLFLLGRRAEGRPT